MGWSSQFVSALDSSILNARYKLTFIGVLNSLGKPFDIYDHTGNVQIANSSIRLNGTKIIPQRWSVSFGGFSLQITGNLRFILPKMRRGQIATLSCSLNGSKFEILAIGSLDTLSGLRGLYNLGFKDLLSALQNSLDTRAGTVFSQTDPPKFSLFYKVGRTTTTTSSFGNSDTTLNLADASFFKKELSVGSKGIVRITNTNHDFYIFWSGSTATELTGCTTADYNNTTRPVSVASGATVTYCAWLQGQPYEIIAKILTSTGAGTNGEFDVFPEQWTIGGKIDKQIFDISDAKRASKEIVRDNGSDYHVGIAVETPLNSGFREIVNLFSTVGIFPVYRQNAISIRACTDPEGIETRKTPDIKANIKDEDIIEVLQHDFFNSDIANIYRTTIVKYNYVNVFASGGIYNSSRVDSLPALKEIERNFSQYYLAQPDNRQSQALQDLRRLRVWDLYISERLVVRVPLRYATLCSGDVVTFISEDVEHLYDPPDPQVRGRYCMVLGCDYSIDDQDCVITLGVPSPKMQKTTDTENSA